MNTHVCVYVYVCVYSCLSEDVCVYNTHSLTRVCVLYVCVYSCLREDAYTHTHSLIHKCVLVAGGLYTNVFMFT